MPVSVLAVGGPTVVLELGGLRLLTDPTFSEPGEFVSSSGARLMKTEGPGVTQDEIGPVDAVLLSHDQHPDNLDDAGRAFLDRVPLVITTPTGAARLGGVAHALAPWEHLDLPRSGAEPLRVTAVPALHGPEGCEPIIGEVTGFVLTAPDVPTVYVSGYNASLALVEQIALRFGDVDTAVLFAGGARTGSFDGALLTIDSAQAARAAAILDARRVIPAHFAQWQHFTEGADHLRAAFAEAGLTERLALLKPGDTVVG
jgi:L-ascorbate metabolism protein UlaG (beta-lactamase superfamily)